MDNGDHIVTPLHLSSMPLFKDVNLDNLSPYQSLALKFVTHSKPKNDESFTMNTASASIHILSNEGGIIKAVNDTPFKYFITGDVFGLNRVFNDCSDTRWFQAKSNVRLIRIPVTVLKQLSNQQPQLKSNIINILSQQNQELENYTSFIAMHKKAQQRVAERLIYLADKMGTDIKSGTLIGGITQEDIASMSLCGREEISRLINSFAKVSVFVNKKTPNIGVVDEALPTSPLIIPDLDALRVMAEQKDITPDNIHARIGEYKRANTLEARAV